MEELKEKRIPYSQFIEFRDLYFKKVKTYELQFENDEIDEDELERKMPKSFLEIHQLLTKILKDNNILAT